MKKPSQTIQRLMAWRECLKIIATTARHAERARAARQDAQAEIYRNRLKAVAAHMDALKLPSGWRSWEHFEAEASRRGLI